MINGFLTDEALYQVAGGVGTDEYTDVGVGYLTDKMINYFVTPTSIFDARSPRLSVPTVSGIAKGDLRFHFDNEKAGGDPFAGLLEVEISDVKIKLFNIIEFLYLSQGRSESELDGDMNGDHSNFGDPATDKGYYKSGTCHTATTVTSALMQQVDGMPATLNIRDWIQFDMVINGGTKQFKVWLKGAAFLVDYPYSTIMEVIWPCDPATFLDMDESSYSNILDAIVDSGVYMGNQLNALMTEDDYSGYKVFTTLYDNDGFVSDYYMPFGVVYKGPLPTSLNIKAAVRNALLALESSPGVPMAPEAVWRDLFPDLFVASAFFILPMWDNTEEIAGPYTIYRSVVELNRIRDVALALYPDDEEQIDNYLEVLCCDANEMMIGSLPSIDNTEITSLVEEHPTYIAVDAVANPSQWNYMEEKTKGFAQKLCQAIARLIDPVGIPMPAGMLENTFDDIDYLTFTNDYIDYHVLKPGSFPEDY